MSTTINVTVDDGGLPAKNRQQTAANRQAYVQGRASRQAADSGVLALRAKRIAEGRDPLTGAQLGSPGASSRLRRIDQEPAANRRDSIEVVRFYSREEENNRFLISGDGASEVPLSLPSPLTIPTFPVLENDTPYPTYTPPTPDQFRILAQQTTRTELAFDPLNPFIATSWEDLTEGQDKTRVILSRAFDETRSFPLGNGRALVVRGRYFAYATVILRRSYSYTRFTNTRGGAGLIEKDTLNYQTVTAEVETNWIEQEDWVGATVGQNSVQLVEVPQALKDAIVRKTQDTETLDFIFESYVCVLAANNTGGQGTNYDEGSFQCAGYPGTYGYEVYSVNQSDRVPFILSASSSLRSNANRDIASTAQSSYGLTSDGQQYPDDLSTSPAAWFNIISKDVDQEIEEALTHEDLYAITYTSGIFFGGLFKDKALVNIDAEGLRWAGARLQGDVYSFPNSVDPGWRRGLKFLPAESIEGTLQKHYFYDWNQKEFCRQQAIRYGITL